MFKEAGDLTDTCVIKQTSEKINMKDNQHCLLAVLACVVFCKGIKGETDLGLGLSKVKAWQTTQCSCCKRLLMLLSLPIGCCRTSI